MRASLPALAVLAAFTCAAALPGQSVRRFDFGPRSGPVAAGFTAVELATSYGAARGYGWTVTPSAEVLRPAPTRQVVHSFDASLLRDAAQSSGEMRFRVDLAPGRWVVVVYFGDLGDPTGTRPLLAPLEGLDVLANGALMIDDASARTLARKASTDGALGGYKRASFAIDVPSGALELGFRANAGTVSAMGVELYPHREAPLAFDHGAGTLVASPSHAAALAPALAAFQAHDYAAMQQALALVADPLARAWGQAWLLGWLTGAEDDVDLALLASTRALLESLAQPDDVRVAELLAELRCFERGAEMNAVRGYSSTIFPASLDDIVFNLCAAAQLFEQMDDDLLRAEEAQATPSPFFAKAQFLLARNLYSRNTMVGDPATPYNRLWLPILQQGFAPRTALFPRSQELAAFTWFATNFALAGGLVQNWRGIQQLPPLQPAQAWWAPLTEYADHPAAPAWANHQRAYVNGFRAAGRWWMEGRLYDGELGGGGGDDVEGAGLLSLPTLVRTEPGNVLERGVADAMELVLFGAEMNVEQGYFAACGDVEHAGEYTTNPLFALLPTNYGEPRYLEVAMRTLRNFDELADPAPWSQLLAPARRHFRAYNFGATSICGAARDIPLNMRAVIPGFTLQDYAGIPRLDQLFDQLARAWATDALSTAQSKPAGIFPSAVSLANPPVFGTGGSWWLNGGYVDLPSGSAYHAYLYTLLLSAYQRSTAPDRALLLEPVYRAALLVDDFIQGVLTGTAAGQPRWTADTLKGPIANAAFNARGALAIDPVLALTPADLARIDRVIDTYASPYAKFRNQRGALPRDKSAIEATFADARAWLRYLWPMGTTSVTYTDRIYVFAKGSHQLQYSCVSGGSFDVAPTFPVTWSNPDPAGGELDVAILVSEARPDLFEALLFNFDPRARDVELRVWRGLDLGDYELRLGNDANHDDQLDGSPHTTLPVRLERRGQTLRLPSVPSGVLQIVQLVRLAPLPPAPALRADPALSSHDVRLVSATQLEVLVHNLGNTAVPAGAQLELLQGAQVLATANLPAIPAPLDLTPRSITANLPYAPPQPGAPIQLRVLTTAPQITSFNDAISVLPARPSPTVSIQNVIAFGRFEVQIDSPFDASELYWIGVSGSGTAPGIPLGNGLVMPVNYDAFTAASLEPAYGLFTNAFGVLDAAGRARMQVSLPRLPILVGLRLHFAGATADYGAVRAVSGAIVHSL
ncbi:MAG: hypothetical protein JNM84_08125 [Planctomycetes bacterium]|nr:hypothetical protein [Planctomycetota bacterium]